MGVIVVDDDTDVWGASNSIIHSMIEFFLEQKGAKDYLIDFKNAFDWGYNSFRVSELNNIDFDEFITLTQMYIDDGEFKGSGYASFDVKDAVVDLLRKMREAQRNRLLH